MEDKKRMQLLIEEINKHDYLYHTLDAPIISDMEYDDLMYELVKLEKKYGIMPASPTNRIGGTVLEGFSKHNHRVPLYSLNKCKDIDTMKDWIKDVKAKVPNADFSVEYKYDGLSLSVIYSDGKLVKAATRGNGYVGEDVTLQAKTIKSLPLQIDFKGDLIVRGEVLIKLSDLEKYNKTADEPLKNARNAVAGAIRNLDPKITAKRNLTAVMYTVMYKSGEQFKAQKEEYDFLKANKFYVADKFHLYKNEQGIVDRINEIDKEKNELDFLTDGAVVSLNHVDMRQIIGSTARFPKWAMAFKFKAEEVTTILKDVIWQVGRTGKVTPTGLIEPVELAGATVKRATLNNYGDILRKKVKIGAKIFVRRSNEVIPEILGIAEDLEGSKQIEKIKNCPSCGSKLEEIGANLFCLNTKNCEDQIIYKISHFSSRDAMNITGFSEQTIKALYEELGVRDFSDLYHLKKEQLIGLEGFKDKKSNNIIKAIEKSKHIPLNRFIYALGISNVGKKTAKDLAKEFKTFENIKNSGFDQLNSLYDVGEIMAEGIVEYFANNENLEIINKLFEAGVEVQEQANNKGGIFEGQTFVLTGTLETLGRREASGIIEKNGGEISSSVSKNTSYVLAGEKAGSKLDKAKKLGVKIISEKDFLKKVNA